jgi:prepilin-type N-terminal cleavage/methylation domain-containing protein
MTRHNNGRTGFTVTEMLVVIAIIGIMMALLLPAVQMVRESGRKTVCANNLSQIGKAIAQHEVHWQNFPSAGIDELVPRSGRGTGLNYGPLPYNEQGWGWAYQILPFMEKEGPYMDPDPARAAGLIVPSYFCPTRRKPQTRLGSGCGLAARTARGALDYAGNGGIGSPTQAIYPAKPDAWSNQNGTIIPIGYNTATGIVRFPQRVNKGEIPDGVAYTILVGERNFNRQMMVDPTQPDEDNGYIAGYSWDTIRWGYEIPAKDRTTDTTTGDTRFGSSHHLVCQFVLCNGAVKSINYSIDLAVFQGLCHREDKRSPEIP